MVERVMGLDYRVCQPGERRAVEAFERLRMSVFVRDADRRRPGALVEKMPPHVREGLRNLTSDMVRYMGEHEMLWLADRNREDEMRGRLPRYMSSTDARQLKLAFDRKHGWDT